MSNLKYHLTLPSPLEPVRFAPLSGVRLWVKRDDLIHPIISGNKWRKLKGLLERPLPTQVVSFGGARSHHLPALACALSHTPHTSALLVVRGDELSPQSNPTLRFCEAQGARLVFVSRERYRALRERGWALSEEERSAWGVSPSALILPEGGDAEVVREGCAELWRELETQWVRLNEGPLDELWLCAGTGATARGVMSAMPVGCSTRVVVVSAVKGAKREQATAERVAEARSLQLEWVDERRFGGFGRLTPEVEALRGRVEREAGLWVDRVYQPKLLAELIRRARALEGRSVVWLHTGGARALEDLV